MTEKTSRRKNQKRLNMYIPERLHSFIKSACEEKNITITVFVQRAIFEKLIKEEYIKPLFKTYKQGVEQS